MYAIYGHIYHQYTPNVSIYTIHGSYGIAGYRMVLYIFFASLGLLWIPDLRYHEKNTTKHMAANKWKDWTDHLRETMCCTPDIGISCASLQGWQWKFPHLHGRKNQAGNQKDKQAWAVYWIHVQPQSDWISSYICMFFNILKLSLLHYGYLT